MSETPMRVPVSYALRERMGIISRSPGKACNFSLDTVAIQKDILEARLGSIGIPNEDREEIQQELDLIKNRLGYARRKSGIVYRKKPLFASTGCVRIQTRETIGRAAWKSADRGWGPMGPFGTRGFDSSATTGAYKH